MLPESVLNKLNSLVLRKKDLEDQLSSEGATEDISKFTSLNKEYSEITPVVELYGNYNHSLQSIQESKEMLDLEDREIIELAKQEIEDLESSIEIIEKDLKLLLLPKDNADDGAAYLEIRELEPAVTKLQFLHRIYCVFTQDFVKGKVGNLSL